MASRELEPSPLVSIVVPTFNAGSDIKRLTESISIQTYQNFELMIVDNLSPDKAVLGAAGPKTTIIYVQSGMAAARNLGAIRASGSYLLHLDADMELAPNVVESCVRICESESVDALIIPEVSVGTGFWARCVGVQKCLVRDLVGYEGVRFVSRDAFNSVSGYDENLEAGEDFDFYYRLEGHGCRISRTTAVISHHVGSIRFSDIVTKLRRYGMTAPRFRAKYGVFLTEKHSFVRLLVRRWRILAKDPVHSAGYLFLALIAKVAEA